MYRIQENDIAEIILLRAYSGNAEIERNVYARKSRITVGRDAYTDVYLDDPTVSRVHAVIYRKSEGFVLYDRSANGMTVNGRKVTLRILEDKDEISIGPFRIAVELYKDCESSFHERAAAEGWTMDEAHTLSLSAVA